MTDEQAKAPTQVRSRAEKMHATGDITKKEWIACDRWLGDYEVGVGGARIGGGLGERVSGGSHDGYSETRLDALTRLREVREHVGSFGVWLIEQGVAREVGFPHIGVDVGANHETAKSYLIAAIKCLAAYYAVLDCAKDMAPERGVRFSAFA